MKKKNPSRLLNLIVAVAVFLSSVFLPAFFGCGTEGKAWASGRAVVLPADFEPSVEEHELAEGVRFVLYRDRKNLAGEQLHIYVLEVDLRQQDVEILPVVAGGGLGGRETVARMAARTGAVAAVNGAFYYTDGNRTLPVGNLLIEGEPWSISGHTMASAALSRFSPGTGDLEFRAGFFAPVMELLFPAGSLRVDGVNIPSSAEGVYLFTFRWGERLEAAAGSYQVALSPAGENSYTVSAAGSGPLHIPPEGIALRFQGEPWRGQGQLLHPGDIVSVNFTYDRDYWGEIEHLLTAGPLLVEEGEPVFQAVQEGFTGSVLLPNPRTAFGVTKDDKVLLVVAERAERGSRVGLTLDEMALLMAKLGAFQAVGLDGGGSSTFYAGGRVWNNAGASPREVANGLMVLTGLKLYLNNSRIFPDVPPYIAGEGRTMVPIRVIMEHLGAGVEWEPETRTVAVSRGEQLIELVIDSREARVGGEPVLLDAPPVIREGRTLVPVRFVTENLRGGVHWDAVRRAVYLTAPR